MAGLKIHIIVFAIFLALIVVSGQRASEHHFVGDDKGWDTSTDLNSWSSGRLFIVGDVIWFNYTTSEESVVELKSMLELSSCDLSNPIKMYTDGLDKVPLDGEGTRFFASGNSESCKKGLKMHVKVHPIVEDTSHNDDHLSLEINPEGDDSSYRQSPPSPEDGPDDGPDDDSPPTPKPKPKPKPKRPPPPPYVGPDSPPTPKPKRPPPPPSVGPDSPPTPKPKPNPPPPYVGPDDDSPPTPKPKPKPKPSPEPSSSTMLDGCLFSVVVALFLSYFS